MENEKKSYSDFLDRMNILNSGGKLQCPYCGEGFIARIEDGVYSCEFRAVEGEGKKVADAARDPDAFRAIQHDADVLLEAHLGFQKVPQDRYLHADSSSSAGGTRPGPPRVIPVRCLQYITKLQAVSITSLGISPIGLSLTLYRRFTIINTQSI